MSERFFDQDDPFGMASHPSSPFNWIEEQAAPAAVIWAIELSESERRKRVLELADRGQISKLDPQTRQRFAALVLIIRDRRLLGLV
jgi:hypothetical protein